MERESKDNSSKYTLKDDRYEQYDCQSDKSSTPYYAQTECNLPLEEILKEDERILKRFGSNNKKPEPPQKIDVSTLYDKASLLGLGFEKLGKSILHLSSRLTNIDDLSSETIEWWEALLSGVPYLGGIVEPNNGRILLNLGNEGYALLTGDSQSVFEYMEIMSQASNNTALFWQFPLLVGLEPDLALEAEDLMLKSGDKETLDKYLPEVEEDNTTESKLKSTTKKEKSANLNNSEQIEALNVAELTNVEKLTESIKRSAKALPGEVADELQAIFTPATLATMVTVFAVYVAAHATGIGQAMDIGMLIAGGIFFGMDAFTIFKDIAGFANAVNAQNEDELDKAGQHLASAVAKIGVDAVMTLLTKKVADKVADTGKKTDTPKKLDDGSVETTGDMDEINRSIRRHNSQTDRHPYTVEDVGNEIVDNSVATEAYKRITDEGYDVRINHDRPDDPDMFGETLLGEKNVEIYEQNNMNAEDVVGTMVHESVHVEYRNQRRIRYNTQYEEYRAFVREEIYRNSKDPTIQTRPTMRKRREIWEDVKRNYDFLPLGKNPFGGSR